MTPKKRPYLNLFKIIWQFSAGKHWQICGIYLLFILANLIRMAEPYFLGRFINAIQTGGPQMFHESIKFMAIYASISFFFWALHGPARCLERKMSFSIYQKFSQHCFRIISELPLAWHKDHHSGESIDKINKASLALRNFTDSAYVYIESIIPFFVSLIAIVAIIKWYGLLLFVFTSLVVLVIFLFDDVLIKTIRERNRREHRVSSVLYDYVSNMISIITLRLQERAQKDFSQKISHVFPVHKKNIILNEWKWFSVSMAVNIAQFLVIVFYIYQQSLVQETILIGNLMMLYRYLDKFIQVFFHIAWKYENLVMTGANLMAADSILRAGKASKKKSDLALKKWKKIEIKNLSFQYQDESTSSLQNINITLEKNSKIALLGESGSGKSTLLNVLRGLYESQDLKIEIDGKNNYDIDTVANLTTLIPQDPEIFENTIEYNVTMGMKYRQKDILNSLRMARFDRVLERLPSGIKTNIKEKGVNLSGGEKQRLALARGILASQKSSIVLLDEPTSSVDQENEREIYRALWLSYQEKCIISTLHKLNLLSFFDFAYVLNRGRIIEQGPVPELLQKKSGYLRGLWEKFKTNR